MAWKPRSRSTCGTPAERRSAETEIRESRRCLYLRSRAATRNANDYTKETGIAYDALQRGILQYYTERFARGTRFVAYGKWERDDRKGTLALDVALTVENSQSLFTAAYRAGEEIAYPVAHHDGNYYADAGTLDMLEGEGRVAFRYAASCNGSARDIAGVLSANGRVLGMMPHPERAIEAAAVPALGGADGRRLFENILASFATA